MEKKKQGTSQVATLRTYIFDPVMLSDALHMTVLYWTFYFFCINDKELMDILFVKLCLVRNIQNIGEQFFKNNIPC